jgi:hypothetical protein
MVAASRSCKRGVDLLGASQVLGEMIALPHYNFPAFAYGSDGMEHIGATNRLGYSRTYTGQGAGFGIGAAHLAALANAAAWPCEVASRMSRTGSAP